MTPPTIGVLALQGDVADHQRALVAAGAEAITVRRTSELDACDGLVIPGGESTTIDRLTRTFGLREPLIERIGAGMPTYGSCAGMIMLADEIIDGHRDQQTLGGLNVSVRRNAFGRQVDSFEADLDVTGLDAPLRAIFIRAPWVERVGAAVDVLATVAGADGRQHPVAVRQGHLLATSFHPEVTGDGRIHALFASMVEQSLSG